MLPPMDDGRVFGAPSLEQRLKLGRDNVKVVLVVGERPEQASALAERLGLLGVDAIVCARDTRLALRSIIAHDVSLILLDVHDFQDSARLIGTLNDVCDAPLIARGVMTDTDHVVAYLESGAADFVSRTTTLPVLAAKIQSLLRSVHSNGSAAALIEVGEVSIDLRSRSVTSSAANAPDRAGLRVQVGGAKRRAAHASAQAASSRFAGLIFEAWA